MIDMETRARIRHLFHAEHWKVGTIAAELRLHPETVARALETERFRNKTVRGSSVDAYAGFIREVLAKHPNLRATRHYRRCYAIAAIFVYFLGFRQYFYNLAV